MKKKIIITGALGYIGTELCKLYSGISWNSEIVAIDNRFVAERVNQLKNWRIKFLQGDILDKQFISAAIKEVAQTKVGDTIVQANDKKTEPLRGIRQAEFNLLRLTSFLLLVTVVSSSPSLRHVSRKKNI